MPKILIDIVKIEGRDLTVSDRNLSNSNYLIHNGKIYDKKGSQGIGKNLKYCLEKESTKERIWIGHGQIKELLYVIKPTGYMKI